uniref:Uncharacterized protein n=1 Tax=Meloidogyne incognita TaxID=6306 RepID=A0A914LP09_MELIC
MEQQQNPQPSLEDSFALKPGEDLDVELKKAKLEYFRIQVSNSKIKGKLLAMEYEEKMEKKREEEKERMKPRIYI